MNNMLIVGKLTKEYRMQKGIHNQKYMFSLFPADSDKNSKKWESRIVYRSLSEALEDLEETAFYLWQYPFSEYADDMRQELLFLCAGIRSWVEEGESAERKEPNVMP